MSDKIEKRFCNNCNKVTTFRLRRQADIEMESLRKEVSKQKNPSTVKAIAKFAAIELFNAPNEILNIATFETLDIGKKWYCSKCGED